MKKLFIRLLKFTLSGFISAFILGSNHAFPQLSVVNSAFGNEIPPLIIAHVTPTTGRFALHAEADRRESQMAIEEFVDRYRKRYGQTRLAYPGEETHAAHLATKTLLTAINRAGSTDNHAVILQLEKYKSTAKERMQNTAAYVDPLSHRLQRSIYIARWNPRAEHQERGLEIREHIPPEQVKYDKEKITSLESLTDIPHHTP